MVSKQSMDVLFFSLSCHQSDSGVFDSNFSQSCSVGILQKALTTTLPLHFLILLWYSSSLDDIYICLYLPSPCFELIFILLSFINFRQTHNIHIKPIHNTHPCTLRLITPITSYFYLQPTASLWSDTQRMFAVHPLHTCTLPERKQIITTTITSHLLLLSLPHPHSPSSSLPRSIPHSTWLLIS